ncbi:starch-binding protein [Ruminococcus sp.]|uniref:starch-binding protein n=1 Tax=Ruminococcus sp. TaxID=41978 RepID=UPI002E81D95E|nr:starch-binding protein [Ruminococcus sp.]MEE3492953.1 starch-binding protein [Ruminococcus sp.]
MKRKITTVLAVLMAIIMACGVLPLTAAAATNTITYTWQGTHAYDAGFAQGTIKVTVDGSSGGTYYLYWADDSAALSGFEPICKLSIANNGTGTFTMPENTAIPAKATRVLAFKSSSEPSNLSASNAALNYKLPIDKATNKTDDDLLYSFASYSDIHITSDETGAQGQKYPYDEQHLADALRTAAARDVDFIVTTGDHVTNHRNDEKGRGNPHYPEEWNTYLHILADSDYDNPIYEAIGNHELWNYEDESNKIAKDWKTSSDYFCNMTGLDSTAAAVSAKKAYYEITEPKTGDHFLFMAQEGGFYSDAANQFTDEQLAWLNGKLTAYENDGKNVFIMEHANFDSWGAGDRLPNPIYDIPLKDKCAATIQLKAILQNHKNAVLLCGHTHFRFSLNYNLSNNSGTSATIIHNSSVGAIRDVVNGNRVNDTSREGTEGYIVEVYRDATIFQGTNLYTNKVIPSATYIVPQSTSPLVEPTDPPAPTQAPTQAPTEAPTEPPIERLYGDADDDGIVSVRDVTFIMRFVAGITLPTPVNELNADVDADDDVTIFDATFIQRYLAGVIHRFPAEGIAATGKDFDIADVGVDADIAVVGAQVEPEPAAADLNTLRTQAKSALDKYWLLASYDQYQALKKSYRHNADYNTLNAAYTAFNAVVSACYPGDTVDVYFTNNVGWTDVYAYCTAGHGKEKNNAWPGIKMTYMTTNSYGEKIYKYTVQTSKYIFVIFNNGSNKQTIDLPLGAVKDQGYYYDTRLGLDDSKYRCSFYKYH